jgi:hypothetical protein
VSLFFIIALHARALHWRIFGGIEGAKTADLHNDMNDVEYAVLGAFGSGLVTKDDGARDTYEDLLFIATSLWG